MASTSVSQQSIDDVSLPDEDSRVPQAARDLYARVAAETDRKGFNSSYGGMLPSRSPYKEGEKMGRGARFAGRFKKFIETGGVAKWKNCVVMNIRLNDLRDIESANGNGTFKASFFLDTAFWVPWWDMEHFETQATVGTFSDFEPFLDFPEVDAENGRLRWGLRTAEFSKDKANSRQHEIQLGQNFETLVFKPVKRTVSVVDPCSHWPRLWRVCLNDDEVAAMSKMDKKQKKKLEPTNEEPTQCIDRLKQLFTKMDKERIENLREPTEGVAFVTYEVSCIHRCEFQLHEFPFDMHSLKIVVRLDRKEGDPMNRTIIPIAHDKGFFISSRVAKMVNYHLARNLDWEVTKENVSFGSSQHLNASAIVRRKPGYFVRNYVIVIFLLTSSSFSCFLAKPDECNTRAAIIFTVLLSVVAFKYTGSNQMPRVSYATILDAYILLNFYIVLCVAVVSFGFSTVCQASGIRDLRPEKDKVMHDLWCSENPGRWYHMDWIPAYDPIVETCVGIVLFIFWLGCNSWYWSKVWDRVKFCLKVIDDVNIGWMIYSFKGPGKKGQFCSEKFINDPSLDKSSLFSCFSIFGKSSQRMAKGDKGKEIPKETKLSQKEEKQKEVEMKPAGGWGEPQQASSTEPRRDLLTQDSMATVGSIGDRL